MNDHDTPMHRSISEGYEPTPPSGYLKHFEEDSPSVSTVLNATSSLSYSVDQVVALFDTLVGKLSPVLTPEGPSLAEDPMTISGSNNSHLFQQLLLKELKLNHLAMAIQDVTRRVDL